MKCEDVHKTYCASRFNKITHLKSISLFVTTCLTIALFIVLHFTYLPLIMLIKAKVMSSIPAHGDMNPVQ